MNRKSLFLCSTLCLSSCAVSPTLRAQNSGFVYVTNKPSSAQQPASILGYSIRDNTGELTAVPGSPFQMSLGADTLAVTSSGRFLYTPSAIPGVQDGWGVSGYAIDANSGSLTPVPGSPFYARTSLFGPAWPIMDPSGKFLYVMTYYYSQVFVYLIGQNTGALTLEPNLPFVTQYYYPTVFTLDATGQFAYIAYQAGRSNGPAIPAYRIDPTSGSFTLVPGSPFIIPNDPSAANKNGPSLTWAATDPSAGFLYVADSNQLDLWTFAIDGTSGALTLTPTSPMHMPHGSNQFAFDPTSGFAYFTTLYPNSTDCANFFPYSNVYAPDSVFCLHHRPDNWRSFTS